MTDTELLQNAISNSGLKVSFIARRLNISRQCLHGRLCGTTEFKGSEIKELCNLLNLDIKDKERIFFA